MSDDLVKPPFYFDRYINGVRMAEDVCVERETTLESAMLVAARIASKGPNGEAPVLVYRAPVTHPAPDAAARQDAKEAETYAWKLEEELRDTQDRANAFATKEYYTEMRAERAEAKLAKAVEALDMIASITVHSGGEIHGVTAQHWRTAFEVAQDEATITLAEIKGESHD